MSKVCVYCNEKYEVSSAKDPEKYCSEICEVIERIDL